MIGIVTLFLARFGDLAIDIDVHIAAITGRIKYGS